MYITLKFTARSSIVVHWVGGNISNGNTAHYNHFAVGTFSVNNEYQNDVFDDYSGRYNRMTLDTTIIVRIYDWPIHDIPLLHALTIV